MAQFLTDAAFAGKLNINSGNDLRLYRSDNGTYARFNYAGGSVGLDIDDLNGDGINLQQNGVNKLRIETNGNATFAGNVIATAGYVQGGSAFISTQTIGGTGYAMFGSNSSSEPIGIGRDGTNLDIAIDTSGNTTFAGTSSSLVVISRDNMFVDAGQLYIGAAASNVDNSFRQVVGSGTFKLQKRISGTFTDALAFDSSLNATFAGKITSGNDIVNATAGVYTWTGDTDTFIQRSAANQITFKTGASDALVLDSSQDATFAGEVQVDARVVIRQSDIAGGEGVGLQLVNAAQDQLWNVTCGVTSVDNTTFNIRNSTTNVNVLKLATNNRATFAGNVIAAGTLTSAGLTTTATININNPAADKKISFDRTGGKGMSIEHDASSIYFYNETDAVTMFKMFNAGSATVTGDFTVNGGDIVLGGTGRIQGIDTVSASTDAVNKAYADARAGTVTQVNVGTGLDVTNQTTNPTVSLDLNELNDVDGDADQIDFFVAVDESDDSVRIGRDDMKNVDAHWMFTPFVLNSNFLEQTNTTSYINVPFNNTNDSTSSEYYNFFGCPYPGRVKSMTLMHVDGNMSSSFTTQLRVKKNGANTYTSGELTPSNGTNDGSYVQQDDIHTNFVKGDRLQFAFGKSVGSRYWQGATMTIVLEFLQYNS